MSNESEKAPREMSDEELQDESKWDFENAEPLPPQAARKARAIVSVAFPGAAFDCISAAARNANMRLSQFIREAAMEKAATVTPTLYLNAVPTETQGFSSVTQKVSEGETVLAS